MAMKNILSSFKPIITFGDLLKHDERREKDKNYNGLISSLFLFILLSSISFSFILANYFVCNKADQSIKVYVVLIFYLLLAFISIVVFFIFKPVQLISKHLTVGRIGVASSVTNLVSSVTDVPTNLVIVNERIKLALRDNISIIGMSCFFILTLILDAFNIIAPVSCQKAWKTCDSHVYSAVVMEVTFYAVRLVYIAVELIFCASFHRKHLINDWRVKLGIALIQSANISLWFYSLVRELHELKGEEGDDLIKLNSNYTALSSCGFSNETWFIECLAQNSTEYGDLKKTGKMLRPFLIEFTLLAGECFGHLFFSGAVDGQNSLSVSSSSDNIAVEDFQSNQTDESSEIRPLVDRDQPDDNIHDNQTGYGTFATLANAGNTTANSAQTINGSSVRIFICFVLSLAFGILLCIWGNLKHQDKFYSTIFTAYRIVYHTLVIVFIMLGYATTNSFLPDPDNPFTGIDFLLLLSTFGPFMVQTFSINALISKYIETSNDKSAFMQDLTLDILDTLAEMFQVTFLFYADRVAPKDKNSFQAGCFRGILLFLAIQNAAYWVLDSFIENSFFLQNNYYDSTSWESVNSVLTPLVLYFRLNSALMFLRAYWNC